MDYKTAYVEHFTADSSSSSLSPVSLSNVEHDSDSSILVALRGLRFCC